MFRRINHTEPKEENTVQFEFDGTAYEVAANISVAAAVLTITNRFRTTPMSASWRGPHCMMGGCFDCLLNINGEPNQRSCMIMIEEGMTVETQKGSTELSLSP